MSTAPAKWHFKRSSSDPAGNHRSQDVTRSELLFGLDRHRSNSGSQASSSSNGDLLYPPASAAAANRVRSSPAPPLLTSQQIHSKFLIHHHRHMFVLDHDPADASTTTETTTPSALHLVQSARRKEHASQNVDKLLDQIRHLRRRSRSVSPDPWSKLVNQEQKTMEKYFSTNKNLLASLESEQERFHKLEAKYQLLLKNLESIPKKHKHELQRLEQKYEEDIRSLKKVVLEKTEESIHLTRKLADSHDQHKQNISTAASRIQKLDKQIKKLQSLLLETEDKSMEKEKELITTREALIQTQQKVEKWRSRGDSFQKLSEEEREAKLQLEAEKQKLEKQLWKKNEEWQKLEATFLEKSIQFREQSKKYQKMLSENKDIIDSLKNNEDRLLQSLEMAAKQERELGRQLEEASTQYGRVLSDLEKLREKETESIREIERLKSLEDSLRKEISDLSQTSVKQAEQISELRHQEKSLNKETQRLKMDLQSLSDENSGLQAELTRIQNKLQTSENTNKEILNENQDLISKLQSKQSDVAEAKSQLTQLFHRLQDETQSKSDLEIGMKKKIHALQDRLSEAQDNLHQTKLQIASQRELEGNLRLNLEEKTQLHSQLSEKVTQLLRELDVEKEQRDQLTLRQRQEITNLQSKLQQIQDNAELEIKEYASKVDMKQAEILDLRDQVSKLRQEVSQSRADSLKLEAKITELTSLEDEYHQQKAILKQQMMQKNRELSFLTLKHQNSMEQVERMQNELHRRQRQESGFELNEEKDRTGLSKLQDNVSDLTRRLKEQVDALIEPTTNNNTTTSQPRKVSMKLGDFSLNKIMGESNNNTLHDFGNNNGRRYSSLTPETSSFEKDRHPSSTMQSSIIENDLYTPRLSK